MPETDLSLFLVLAAALVAGGLVKGLVGVALPMVSISILSAVIDVRLALGLISIPILSTNLWQAFYAGAPRDVLQRHWALIVCMLLGIWFGTLLVVELPVELLYGLIGVAVVGFTAVSILTPQWSLPLRMQIWAGPLAGAASGILGGLSTIWGPPLVMYFVMIRLPKEDFIRTAGLIWFAGSIPLLLGYVSNGMLSREIVWLSAAAVVPSFAGFFVGQWLRGKIDPGSFRKVLLVVLFLLGLNLIRRALI